MKRNIFLVLLTILTFAVIPAEAQFDALKKKVKEKVKTEETKDTSPERKTQSEASKPTTDRSKDAYGDTDFLFMGKNDLDGDTVGAMTACVPGVTSSLSPPASKRFKVWITEISEVAALRTFNKGECQIIGFRIEDNPQYKYKNVDSLAETAQGHSVYKVEGDKLSLVKKFEASQFYIVVVPEHAKTGLKLADLRLCGAPDTIKLFRRKTEGVSNCHDLQQSLYVFERYKSYPGPMQTNSVIFNATDFESLDKQGKFKGLVIYKLSGEELMPVN